MTWPVAVFWVLLAWGLVSRRPVLIYLFFATAAFGSLAVIPVETAGGVNLLPQPICACALLWRLVTEPRGFRRAFTVMFSFRGLGLLSLFFAVSIATTLFTPRIFAGSVDVVSIAGVRDGPRPLAPGSYNLTQGAYLGLSIGTVVAFAMMARYYAFEAVMRRAFLTGCAVLATTGIGVAAADATGLSALLEPFRTVSYVLFTEVETLGGRRLVGLMPEASTFGGLAVLYCAGLVFLLPSYEGLQRRFALAVTAVLIVLAVLSTSSTAYVGLAACAVLFVANWVRRLRSGARQWRSDIVTGLFAALVLVALGVSCIILAPQFVRHVNDVMDSALFQKVSSDSYIERMRWNQTALNSFFASQGLGVGLGSARASNWFVALLSNTGAIATGLMACFIFQTFGRRAVRGDPFRGEMLIALKASLLVGLVLAALAGTSADFGVGMAALYGMITGFGQGGPRLHSAPEWRRQPRACRDLTETSAVISERFKHESGPAISIAKRPGAASLAANQRPAAVLSRKR